MVKQSPTRLFATLCAVAALAACESSVTLLNEAPLAAIRIGPQPAVLELENTLQLDAVLTDASGAVITGPQVFWSSENTAVARVSPTGEVTGVSPGTTRISASAEGVSAVVTITVVPRRVARVTLTPDRLGLVAGESGALTAALLDSSNRTLEGRTVEWRSSDAAVATVDNRGMVTARGEGSAQITATSEGVSGGATVIVARRPVARVELTPTQISLLVGESQPFAVIARADDGSTLEGRQTTWSSSDPAVITVAADGVATGRGPGQAVVTATVEQQSATAAVTVSVAPVATVELSPTSAQLFVGATQQITATLKAAGGAILTGRTITWSSSYPGVATVSGTGLVTAVEWGQTTITATSEGKSASAQVTVRQVPVATVDVTPTSAQMVEGTFRQFAATAKDANGNTLAGRAVSWSSDAPNIASVSGDGLVTGVFPGQAIITATIEGKSASSALTVVPVAVATVDVTPGAADVSIGGTVQLTATPRSATGTPLSGRVITWTSSAPAIASVNGTGVVTGVALGQATITATSEGRSGAAVITVKVVPVATVEVTPSTATLLPTQTRQLTATTKDASGNVLTGRTVTWSSSNTQVATVAGGLVTAVAPGSATITASSEGKSGTASVTVLVPVATVDVTPASTTVAVNGTRQFTATTRDAAGNVLTGRAITWMSSNPSIATVNSSGLATGVAAGQVTITATSEGKSDGGALAVTVPPVATVEVTPSASTLNPGQTQQFTATLKASDGTVLTGRTITWSSDKPQFAAVNATTGLVTAVAPGTAKITATSEGKHDDANVTVQVPVATVEVSPTSASVTVGQTRQFTAVTKAANGTILNGRAVTWSTSNASVATVNSTTGLATGVAAGQATITATSEGKTGSGALTVTPPPVATVELLPTSASMTVGQTRQFTVTLKAADGTTLTGRVVTFASSNPLVASVDSSGLVRALLVGSATITATSEGKSDTSSVSVSTLEAEATASSVAERSRR